MENKALVVYTVVVFLGLLVIATGFAAEGTKVKLNHVIVVNRTTCKYPKSPAVGLGLVAALSLLLAHITLNFATGCFCCFAAPRSSISKWRIALICYVISWITFAKAFIMLLTGAALNDQRGEQSYFLGYCYVLRSGFFIMATIVATVSIVLGLAYYILLNSTETEPSVFGNPCIPPQANIAMGQPQFPPPPHRSADPVFVPEDTYMRRQFT